MPGLGAPLNGWHREPSGFLRNAGQVRRLWDVTYVLAAGARQALGELNEAQRVGF